MLVASFYRKGRPILYANKNRIFSSSVVGTDETGCKINGKNHWFWTWQNEQLTFIAHSVNRGIDTIKRIFAEGLPNSILNHDRWASHFHCKSKGHQLCTSHLQRDFNYLEEIYQSKWATSMKAIISRALELKKHMTFEDYYKHNKIRDAIEEDLSKSLQYQIEYSHKKAIALQKTLANEEIVFFYFYTITKCHQIIMVPKEVYAM